MGEGTALPNAFSSDGLVNKNEFGTDVNVLPVYGSDSDSDIEASLPALAPLKLVRTQSLVYHK